MKTATTKPGALQCLECRTPTEADVIIWGKLAKRAALGPRCMRHAEAHLGRSFPSNVASWAVVDLRNPQPARTWCRQCRDERLGITDQPLPDAVVVIWEPSRPAEALGPKCARHAQEHLGAHALSVETVPHGVHDLRTPAERRAARRDGNAVLLGELGQLVEQYADWDHPLHHGDLSRASGSVPVSALAALLAAHGGGTRPPQ